jgi:hypothetical protein
MEKLKGYLSYRSMPVYCYDLMSPVELMCEAVNSIAHHNYGMLSWDTVELFNSIFKWKQTTWSTLARDEIKRVTARWNELNIVYTTIVARVPSAADFWEFPNSFKVLLKCDRDIRKLRVDGRLWSLDESHPAVSFNDCAVSDIFDYVVDTGLKGPDEVANLIGAEFLGKISTTFK